MNHIEPQMEQKQEGTDGEVHSSPKDLDIPSKNRQESDWVSEELHAASSLSNENLIISENVETNEESYNSDKSLTSAFSFTVETELFNPKFSVVSKRASGDDNLKCKQRTKVPFEVGLLRILNDPHSCSFKVFVGKYKFRCHLQVLQTHSKYFMSYEDVDSLTAQLPVEKVTPNAFHAIYNWMACTQEKRLKLKGNCTLVDIYAATEFLKIDELVEFTFSCLNEKRVTGIVAFGLFLEAQRFDIPMFQLLMLSRCEEAFLPLVASKEFLELDINWVEKLLSSNLVAVNSEIEIFMTAVRWLSYDWSVRKTHMDKLMDCVRFCLLPPLFLRYMHAEQSYFVLNFICQSPKIRETVDKAFVHTSSELCDLRLRVASVAKQFDPPEQRKWIHDEHCSYHRSPGGNLGQFFTYPQFLNYLESLHGPRPDHEARVSEVLAKNLQNPGP
ncbi:actin-binding protein IPP-like isoform X2 [Drosophila ficusphila]|uniref:actin-binding protein IPP-like isoform X2 n=1 Tax=Drosophila ficusphila TaxID=30025 RepID=UPI0007E83A52|nr:actin-binding protein IPP-like isoform X2 [Drosophila ficusphila]